MADKNIERKLGFKPQERPLYNVGYIVYEESVKGQATCPHCRTRINFSIPGQTKFMTEDSIQLSIELLLNRKHTAACPARMAEAHHGVKKYYADLFRGNEQRLERQYRVQRGLEAPQGRA